MSDFGLMFYNARWYDSSLGRFAQADSIIPGVGPEAWDRYAYTLNNPVRYIDPSGHCSGSLNDPDNPDIDCWKMLQHIEDTYSNIHIFNQDQWTYNELLAIADGLGRHVFGKDILSANTINFYREDFGGIGVGGATKDLGNGNYNITIYNFAYNMPPDMNDTQSPKSMKNFEGTLVHELAHVATLQNPSILESYNQEENNHFLPTTIGGAYGWAVCEGRPNCEEIERIAIAAAVWQQNPDSFDSLFYTDWRESWIQTQYSPNPIVDVCYGPYCEPTVHKRIYFGRNYRQYIV